MAGMYDTEIKHGIDERRLRREYILKCIPFMLLIGCMISTQDYSRDHDLKKLIVKLVVDLPIFAVSGYAVGVWSWGSAREKAIERAIKLKHGMIKRVPFDKGFHPMGLIAMSMFGALIVAGDIYFTKTRLADYAIPAVFVGILMLILLFLDYQFSEEEYRIRTTEPNPGFTLGQLIRYKWPVFIILMLMIPFGPYKIAGPMFISIIFWYPLQRRMYLRSQRELGK